MAKDPVSKKIKMPNACRECIFNYDGIDCRLFPELYRRDLMETFDEYEERPEWCQYSSVTIKLEGEIVGEEVK